MLAALITQLMISTHHKQARLPPANIYPFCISALLLSDGKPAPLSELLLTSSQVYTWKSSTYLPSDAASSPYVPRLKLYLSFRHVIYL